MGIYRRTEAIRLPTTAGSIEDAPQELGATLAQDSKKERKSIQKMTLTPYMLQRQAMKNGKAKTSQEQRAEDKDKNGNKPIPKKSAKKIKAEKEAKKSEKMTLGQFFQLMIDCAPAACMETGEPLIYKIKPHECVCHILPKRGVNEGGVPSMAKNPLNIVFLNEEVHTKMDKDLGTKSKGKFVKAMKIYPILKERVAKMWPAIPANERVNIPSFLKPAHDI